ncbi:MAG: thiaminase II [Candidatus Hadarchaeales archaeon]
MRFTDLLYKKNKDLWDLQLNHPFIREMGEGTLDVAKFRFYAKENYKYLKAYARVLAAAVSRSREEDMMKKLLELLNFTVNVEIDLNRNYALELGVSIKELENEEMAPVTKAYSDHLLSAAGEGLCEVLVAVLPCYWGYHEVFTSLKSRISKKINAIYSRTIDLYSGEEGKKVTVLLRGIIDRLAKEVGDSEKKKLEEIFRMSSRYEYLFWDAAYNLIMWPDVGRG